MLDETNSYRLTNTGQGLNRLQFAPRVDRAMHNLLSRVQKACGFWVGSSVIHLGKWEDGEREERDVCVLFFIDDWFVCFAVKNNKTTTEQ